MPLTYERATAILSEIHQHVTNLWAYIYYEGCPRDTTPQNLTLMDERLRSFIERVEKHTEFKKFVPSALKIQNALQETVQQISLAKETFSWPSFLEQRKSFYKAYRGIFKGLVLTRTLLVESHVVPQSSLIASVVRSAQAKNISVQFANRIIEIKQIFLYKQSPLEIKQRNLISFEKEFRHILECLVTSPDLKNCLYVADEVQEMLRETVLLLNFAIDIRDLLSPEEQSKPFLKIHKKVLERLIQLEDGFRLHLD